MFESGTEASLPAVAWVIPVWDWPPRSGGTLARLRLLEGLRAHGVPLEVLVLDDGADEASRREFTAHLALRGLRFLPSAPSEPNPWTRGLGTLSSILGNPFRPTSLRAWAGAEMARSAADWWHSLDEGVVVGFDSLSSAYPFREVLAAGGRSRRCLYRAQNVESEVQRARGGEHPFWDPRAFFFRYQEALLHRWEKELLRLVDGVAAITERDLQVFRREIPDVVGAVVPVGMPFIEGDTTVATPPTLGFLGKLDWPPNRDGLSWFVRRVWPTLHRRRPALRFLVAGSGESVAVERMLEGVEGIEFLGFVDEPASFYERVGLVLAPLHGGGGLKVKVVEALAHGRTVLATSFAMEGIPLEAGRHFLLADEEDEWLRQLEALRGPELEGIARCGRDRLRLTFTPGRAVDSLLPLLRADGIGSGRAFVAGRARGAGGSAR